MAVASLFVAAAISFGWNAPSRDSLPTLPPVVVVAQAPTPENLPEIADWLYLRQAASLGDSTARAALYAKVVAPLARERIPWIEAQARESTNDFAGALRIYRTLSAPIDVLRMRERLARSDAAQRQVRQDLIQFIHTSRNASYVRSAIGLFDKLASDPTSDEQLLIARASIDASAWARARTGFAFVARRGSLGPTDRFRYATALARIGERARAAEQYASVNAGHYLAPTARYQRARMLLALGKSQDAIAQLHLIDRQYPGDTSAAWALWLRADLATDAGADSAARSLWLEMAQRFPNWRLANQARFNAALISFIYGNYATATREFDSLATLLNDNSARYWLGRSYQARNDNANARAVWHSMLAEDSTSYYAGLAAKRLAIHPILHWVNLTPVTYPTVPAVDSAVHRIALLQSLEMTPEIRLEANRLYEQAQHSRERLFATAAAFSETDEASRAIGLGQIAQRKYGVSAETMRLIYPLASKDIIVSASNRVKIDPILVAALIRQESHFNPHAVSPVGARGLMQLMPAVADAIAMRTGIQPWSTQMLFDPKVNITLGVTHLVPLLKKHNEIVYALAAYNAGDSRVTRWSKKRGAKDPEIFTERIPFDETRGYVKNILRSREFYRALYAW